MLFELYHDERRGYVHFRATGHNSAQSVRACFDAICRHCAEHDVSSLLIEKQMVGPSLKLVDIFMIASELSQQLWPSMRRVAYVDSVPEHDLEGIRFAETVAVNRGVNLRAFSTVAEADAWLRGLVSLPTEQADAASAGTPKRG